ncbi:MAG: aminoglycoside phosphotransferase family protein [Chloroflexi bacterium]|nr:aminoglycoside phosphotransferase family protein [Chloroflexota bacterium]
MLNQDPNVPLRELAWSAGEMHDFLSRHALPALNGWGNIADVEIEDMAYIPGRECIVRCSLMPAGAPEDPGRGPDRWIVVTFASKSRMAEITAYYDGLRRSQEHRDGEILLLPEQQCLIETFPMDWRLPSLAQAVDPDLMAPLVAPFFSDDSALPGELDVKPLRYRAHRRCALRYTLGGEAAGVVGKVYERDRRAQRVWDTMTQAYPQAQGCGIVIPRPLSLVDGWDMVIMGWVPGKSMNGMLNAASTEAQAKRAVKLAAGALAAFHSLCVESRDVRGFGTEIQQVCHWRDRIDLIAPELTGFTDNLLLRIESLTRACSRARVTFIHGDFKPSQLLVEGGKVAVVDFDRACLGDPALDVGNFMAHLHKKAIYRGHDYFRRLAACLLEEYEQASPASTDALAHRARLYQSIALLRMGVRTLRQHPHVYEEKGQESPTGLFLQEAARCLEEL